MQIYYKTTVRFSILSEASIADWPLDTIIREADVGELVGYECEVKEQILTSKEMAQALLRAHSEPGFFMITE